MIARILAAGSIAAALAVTPAGAQQTPSPNPPDKQNPPGAQQQPPGAQKPPTAQRPPGAPQLEPNLVGLDIYSSDGQKVGQVAEVGMSSGMPAVRAEVGQFLGLGATSVIIFAKALQRKADRIEITMTANEIKDAISKQREKHQ